MTASPPATPVTAGARRPFFVNLPIDVAIMGGLSIALYVVLWLVNANVRTSTVISLGATLVWIINYPHFSATSHRLYRSRDNRRQYPLTAYLVPVLLLIGAWLSLQSPTGVAPYFVKFFQIWSPYHFSGQTFGIGMLYARRAGVSLSPIERTCLRWFIYSTYLSLIATIETGVRQYQFFGVTYPALGIPVVLSQIALYAMYALGLAVIALLIVRPLVRGQTVASMTLLLATTQFVWFGLGQRLPSFAEFIPAFHSLQYLLVAWSVHLKERLDEGGEAGSRQFVTAQSADWLMTNMLGGFALFWGLPHAASWIGGYDLNLTTAVFFAAIQIHHFFVDGVIWKLKNPRVLSPLLVSLDDLLKSRSTAQARPVMPGSGV
ncbi:MAG: hypothetical protein ABL986_07815 [Vicinamibacterales bacterium]